MVEGSHSGKLSFQLAARQAIRQLFPAGGELHLKAIAGSPGIALGRAVFFLPQQQEATTGTGEPEEEWRRYCLALDSVRQEWLQAREIAAAEAPGVVAILESYLRLLEDAGVEQQVRAHIAAGATAEHALRLALEPVIRRLRHSADVLLQERGAELEQFLQRFLSALQQQRLDYSRAADAIVVALALTPSEILLLHRAGARGLVTAVGGIASHTTILARSLQLPAVIGLRSAFSSIAEGDLLVVDGYTGVVIVHPTPETYRRYERHRDSTAWRQRILSRFAKLPAQTTDGHSIRLRANIASLRDVEEALLVGAEGAGLVRTEVLLLQLGRFPTEEEQRVWYRELAERFYPQLVTLRLFDIGQDKYGESRPVERNPALGVRGVRFLLRHPEVLRTQLRAILRAAEVHTLRILVPMVTTVQEMVQLRRILEQVRQEVEQEEQRSIAPLPLGAMIETPAAALIAEQLAQVSDFFSIGTNDLTQYTVAVDREHGQLAELFDAFHPALWKLLRWTVEAAHRRGIPVGICGELAAHAEATELLVGLGVDELSTLPSAIVSLKHRIRRLSFAHARRRLLAHLGEGAEEATR